MTAELNGNKRRDPRYDVHIQVDCYTREVFLSNDVSNLCKGGVYSDQRSPPQSEIRLTLRPPDSNDLIQAHGRVVWNYDIKKGSGKITPGMGI